jgi:hypothetical protein
VNLGRHMVRIDYLAIPQPNNTHPLFPIPRHLFPFILYEHPRNHGSVGDLHLIGTM